MKKFLFCGFLVFSSWKLYAQNVVVSGFTFEDSGYDEVMVAGYTANGFYVLQSNLPFESNRDRIGFKNRKYRLSFFNHQLNRLWYQNIEPEPQSVVQGLYFHKNKMMAVSTTLSKTAGEQQASILIRLYDENGNKSEVVNAGTIQLSSIPEKTRVIISENRRLTGILLPEFVEDERLRIHFMLLDSTLNQLSAKTLDIPCRKKSFYLEDYQLSDRGDLAMLSIQQLRENKKRLDEYRIHFCSITSYTPEHIVISRQHEETAGAGIVFDNLNQVLIGAGFSAEPSLSSRTSIFIIRIPAQNPAAAVHQVVPVDDNYKFKLASVNERNSANGLFSYPIRKMILRNDGGLVMIAEAFYTYEYSFYDYFSQSYMRRIDYQFNNIVGISIHPDGRIHWLNVIRKTQESTDDGGVFSSFMQMTTDSDLIMVYNNFGNRDNELKFSMIDATGKFVESSTIRSPVPVILLPRFGKQISANEAVIPCMNKKKFSLAKVVF
jgi:hypothetical protein